MKLSEINTYLFLPDFAKNPYTQALCAAIDTAVIGIAGRLDALPLESSRDALMACRPDELAELASEIGAVPYYPDLPKDNRVDILYKHAEWTRDAATKAAIRDMVALVFDIHGEIVVSDDLDQTKFPCRYEITIDDPNFTGTEINIKRYLQCVSAMGRAATTPISMAFKYHADFSQKTAITTTKIIYSYGVKI